MVNFRDLLPGYLKNTRWDDIISTWQTLIDDWKLQVLNRIKDRFDFNKANQEEKEDSIFRLGYDLPKYDGYTNSELYVNKQLSNLSKQIKNKTTPISYDYMYYIFNLIGNVYPMRFGDGKLRPAKQIGATFERPDRQVLFFDQDLPFIQFYINNDPTLPFPDNPPIETGLPVLLFDSLDEPDPLAQALFFDGNEEIEYTGHFVLAYNNKLAETPTDFITPETAKAMYESVEQIKRKIEVPHYQYLLRFAFNPYNATPNPRIEYYITADEMNTAQVESIIVSPTDRLIDVSKIQLGIGSHATLTNSLTGVQVPSTELIELNNNFDIENQDDDILIWETITEEYEKFTIDKELASPTSFGICRDIDPITNPSVGIIRFNLDDIVSLVGIQIGGKFQVDGATNPEINRRYTIANFSNELGNKFLDCFYFQNVVPIQAVGGNSINISFFTSNNFYFFRELGLFDSLNNLIAYVKFPRVSFDERMFTTIGLNMRIVR